jgi:formate-dependent nitrite reductase cytochrome c552 subunit
MLEVRIRMFQPAVAAKVRSIAPIVAILFCISAIMALPVWCSQLPADARTEKPTANAADPYPLPHGWNAESLRGQTGEEAARKSWGCLQCHTNVTDMHNRPTVRLGCTDCHGGDPTKGELDGKAAAHVAARFPEAWQTAANPVRSYTLLNHESPDFIRFVNPGDLRVAHISCGACHQDEVLQVRKSMMTHGCMLWGAALYNNGSVPNKWARHGESYSMHGTPQRLQTVPPPTEDELRRGVVPYLDPLPRYEMSQPGNVLRIFERGGRFRPEVGIPERDDDPGRPRTRLSTRGLGTENRTDPVWVGITKTRLLDPTLNFLGTNDHPGDYRSSGCTACHVVYANDRSPVHSGPYAKHGHLGRSFSKDMSIPKDESGHPIDHKFTTSIPTSQCMVCHMHPGTTVINSYVGYMWWDNETDGELMYPKEQKYPSAEEFAQAQFSNPEEGAARGLWSDPEFLANVTDLNSQTKHTQFADFHGHGWVFRAVFQRDRDGTLLSHTGKKLFNPNNEQMRKSIKYPERVKKLYDSRSWTDQGRQSLKAQLKDLQAKHADVPVHLLDIHLEKGMHCVDCHFNQDNHGNTKLYGEVRAAIEIQCTDCHGSVTNRTNLRTSGPAASEDGTDLSLLRTPFGKRRFEWEGNRLYQNSVVEADLRWEVVQTIDTITPGSEHYNKISHLAKTVRRGLDGGIEWDGTLKEQDKLVWGGSSSTLSNAALLAHQNTNMSCITCHSAWNPSCFGCHLVQKANKKTPSLHNEGDVTRNYTSYNFQTLRDDVFMLARDGVATGCRVNPARSSCAVHVGSYNNNRESIYVQQQTISGDGMSGIAFSTNVPHTVRGARATKMCTDCHIAEENNNNAIMAQLLMHGTNYTNFIGRYCWVATGEHGLEAVIVTERDEPQAVIGSTLHELAFPDYYHEFVEHGRLLEHAHEHPGKDISDNLLHPFRKPEVLSLQHRGEYLYAACGKGGLRVFDIAFIDDKAFAERITTAPVSPFGQRFYVETKFATAVAAPTTIAPDPTRKQHPENMEQPVHALYGYIYVVDCYEGLILVGAATLLDGNPTNNFLKRDLTFNPRGILNGAHSITIVGTYAYICCNAGLVVVSLDDPMHPQVRAVVGEDFLKHPKAVQVQFRYAYVCDEEGIKVLDVTDLANPQPVTTMTLPGAHNIYLARTYAYVAAGSLGLVILNIEHPDRPKIDQIYDADGRINDLHDVKLGITYVSEFAYLADGKNGMHVVQLTTPDTPGNHGFSPRPTPRLIATRKLPEGSHALAISKGVDRDRAVDESGNQIAVFGRVGARPLNLAEQQRLFLYNRKVWKVCNDPDDKRYSRVK